MPKNTAGLPKRPLPPSAHGFDGGAKKPKAHILERTVIGQQPPQIKAKFEVDLRAANYKVSQRLLNYFRRNYPVDIAELKPETIRDYAKFLKARDETEDPTGYEGKSEQITKAFAFKSNREVVATCLEKDLYELLQARIANMKNGKSVPADDFAPVHAGIKCLKDLTAIKTDNVASDLKVKSITADDNKKPDADGDAAQKIRDLVGGVDEGAKNDPDVINIKEAGNAG